MPQYEIAVCSSKAPLSLQMVSAPTGADAVQAIIAINGPKYLGHLRDNNLRLRVIEVGTHAVTFKRPLKERIRWLTEPTPWE